MYAAITGVGFYVPDNVVTNHDMMKYYDTTHEWIVERSGIEERRWIEEEGTGPADLAVPAVHAALKKAGRTLDEIEFIVFATLSPECWFPGSGCFLHEKLGLSTTPALDIRMQCSGFIYGLSIAQNFIKAGMYKRILVVGAEVQSTSLDRDPDGRTVSVLFGDGAGAAVVEAVDEKRGILSTHLYTEGKYAKDLWVPEPSSTFWPKVSGNRKMLHPHMNGREVFKHAVTRMTEVTLEALDAQGWKPEDIDLFIPHQANARIAYAVADQLGMPHSKFFVNINKYGNTTAATIPICMTEAEEQGLLKRGDKVITMAFGSGFTWASAALIW